MATLPDYIVLSDSEFTLSSNDRTRRFAIERVPDAFVNSNRRFRPVLSFMVDPDGANPHHLHIELHPRAGGSSLQRNLIFTEGQKAAVHVLLNTERLWSPDVADADREIVFFHQQGGPHKIDDVVLWFQRNFPSIPG